MCVISKYQNTLAGGGLSSHSSSTSTILFIIPPRTCVPFVSQLRELYRKTVGLILTKTPTHVLENAISVCDKNNDSNVLFPVDYIRCV